MTQFELRDALQEEFRRLHGRMTDVPAFEVPVAEEEWDRYFAVTEGLDASAGNAAREGFLSPGLLDAVKRELPPDFGLEVHDADSGRGASGFALAIEIVGAISDVGGAATTIAGTAMLIRKLHEVVSRHLGRKSAVSRGAAVYLAAADLVDRVEADDFRLIGSGDVNSRAPDAAYTGDDFFWIVFQHERMLHIYIVGSHGEINYMGKAFRRDPYSPSEVEPS